MIFYNLKKFSRNFVLFKNLSHQRSMFRLASKHCTLKNDHKYEQKNPKKTNNKSIHYH